MVELIATLSLSALLAGGFWHYATRLRHQLHQTGREAAASASLETEKMGRLLRANEALRAQNEQLRGRLEDSQSELASLSYSISHDFRAPLRSINGFSQALAEDYGPRLDVTAQDYLRRVRAGALHVNTLIDELLALSRIVRAPFHPARIDLSALAWDCARELAAQEPGRRVEWTIQPDITVWGDRALLETALRHLLGNAWKFTGCRPVAHVGFRVVPGMLRPTFEVRDDGAGFDPQYAGRLFGVFQRMHAASEFPGSGAGLAAVQRIVRRHGGNIEASAQLGEGAVFTFTLDPGPESEVTGHSPAPLAVLEVAASRPTLQPKVTAV